MQSKYNFLLILYIVIFLILVGITIFPDELKTIDRTIGFDTIIQTNKIQIFNLIADVEKYPLILPDTFVEVKILDKSNNSIRTLETAKEIGIEQTLQIRHDLIPFESHEITILDGDAKGTRIVVWFNDIDEDNAKLSITLNLQLKGILVPFGLLPDSSIEHAFNTILQEFVEYAKNDYDSK